MLFLPRLALGGDEEIRTLDPLLAGQVLSQLSYTPVAVLLQGFFSDPENRTTKSVSTSLKLVRIFVFCASCEIGTFVSISSDRLSFGHSVLSP